MSLYQRITEAVRVRARAKSSGNIRTMHPRARAPIKVKVQRKAKPCPPGFVRAFNNPDAECKRPTIKVRRRR